MANEHIIEVEEVRTAFGTSRVHDGISFSVRRGEIVGVLGGSGSGKSVLLREIILLHRPDTGSIRLFGREVTRLEGTGANQLRRRFGVVFQSGALFSGLTVAENIAVPLREHLGLDRALARTVAFLKIALVGLPLDAADKYPGQLSGGMTRRAALARALALDPECLFLDEPSAGLDPVSAEGFDSLILQLRESLGLTVLLVTHDLDSIWRICDRAAFIGHGRVLGFDTPEALSRSPEPLVRDYFGGVRGRALREIRE